MEEFIKEFINKNTSAIFGLLGVLGGGIFTFLTSWLIKKREYNLHLWDKLLERRIKAHENVLAIAIEMRVMIPIGPPDEEGEAPRYPRILLSKNKYEEWLIHFAELNMEASTWLSTAAKREVNFVQDYLLTLHHNLSFVPNEKYPQIGNVIKQDFIDLSSTLEKKAFEYFEKEVQQLKVGNLKEWHKYKRPETDDRLRKTKLMSQRDQIEKIIKAR